SRQRVVEAAHAVVPGTRSEWEDGRGAQGEGAERVRVLRVRLRREGIARLAPLHLVHRGAQRGRPRDERRAVERAAVCAGGQPSTGRETRGEELARSRQARLAVLAEAGDAVVGRGADVLR